jgi:hypothetical protein
MSPVGNMVKRGPDTRMAAKSGTPTMTPMRPTIPVNVPVPVGVAAGTTDVTVSTVGDSSTLDNNPDARRTVPGTNPGAATTNPDGTPATPPVPTPEQAKAAAEANAPIVAKGTLEPVKKGKKEKKPKEPKKKKN